jgi:hypothetical protein
MHLTSSTRDARGDDDLSHIGARSRAKLVVDTITAANTASAKLCAVLGQSAPKRAETCELDALNQVNLIIEQTSRDLLHVL